MLKTIGIIVKDYLVEKGIEEDKNIWVNHQKTEDGISIYETGGLPSRLNNAVEQTYTIQIKTKYSNPSMGSKYSHEVIYQIHSLLKAIQNESINNTHIYYIQAMQPPTPMGLENKRMVYVCNFTICVKV
ncbi:hypothetical protein KK120_18615 [Virgibacillus dakarensis]|nr:hypothetical protein [Virgibacillus dakarensis]